MKIAKATAKYEAWLARQIPLVKADLELKHFEMAADPFRFLRATFYRWCQNWVEFCPSESRTPELLAVGDLHLENFGTWRDGEGRLVWGINDLDEAFSMPYSIDLVRLAVSAHLAIAGQHLVVSAEDACQAILEGYSEGLQRGTAVVLGERNHWLRDLALSELRDPERYWAKLAALPTHRGQTPGSAIRALERSMPEKGLKYRVVHRVAGLGSLGRQRYAAIADWRGGKTAREAKELTESAYCWALGGKASRRLYYEDLLRRARRSPDPFLHLRGRWVVRRLAPDCSRVELASLPKARDESRLLFDMGFETANLHWATPKSIPAVLRDLRRRPKHWLHEMSAVMAKATLEDWEAWRSHWSEEHGAKTAS